MSSGTPLGEAVTESVSLVLVLSEEEEGNVRDQAVTNPGLDVAVQVVPEHEVHAAPP